MTDKWQGHLENYCRFICVSVVEWFDRASLILSVTLPNAKIDCDVCPLSNRLNEQAVHFD